MAGKLCVGVPANNIGAGRISQSRAFCEGLAYRMLGTAAEYPLIGNPHPGDSPDGEAWAQGWEHADDSAGGTLDTDHGRCCAVDYNQAILA